ncbi:helix-turn-helix transcriptional regulator [Sediminicola luteus]|uniref:HTH luxR-type domain-containing protein n=1 Tax=Sediminicola luteus TaxID=319238 RepID=A0A2A4G5T6_9FLAO|nr:LuxR C-terminal-related transcriptional regulator [Sediminicola luteus]PCE63348.1 hypothetical protein B7P33_14105 [Sediminicola luteus]
MRYLIFILFCTYFNGIQAQTGVSGQVDLDDTIDGVQIKVFTYGSQAKLKDSLRLVATTQPDAKGFFEFDSHLFSKKNSLYKIQYMEKGGKIAEKSFIHSQSDVLRFSLVDGVFAHYESTNMADKEWQGFQQLKLKLLDSLVAPTAQVDLDKRLAGYTKDSVKVLYVKLLALNQLDQRNLLQSDISANPSAYTVLLKELQASDIPALEYAFLADRIALDYAKDYQKKYSWSMALNLFLLLGFVVSGAYLFYRKRKPNGTAHLLSSQETKVEALILQGCTNKEIAQELFISVNTVKTHIQNIYRKLEVANRKELIGRFSKK